MSAAQNYADRSIAQGSQSFAAASRMFDEATRRDVAKLYAWCRHCDDVIDGQALGHGQVSRAGTDAERLADLEAGTRAALDGQPPNHPAFQCLAEVAARHRIPAPYPLAHLDGFRMDVEERRFERLTDLMGYCYGVAGVVGIMMTHVMVGDAGREQPDFDDTLDRACDLGLAFQLTNIARDIVDDAREGRLYLPLEWLARESIAPDAVALPEHRPALARFARRLVEEAEPYYLSAHGGIARLPFRAAWAVDAARGVYRAIGTQVVARGPSAWDTRTSTGKAAKLGHLMAGGFGALASRARSAGARPSGLWQRPREEARQKRLG
ncbi:MAG: phytoene synthase [Mesorhizobium amorphae]|nr:MAG: phytoene synthase [Mesorhizobium amorphae]